MNSVISMPKTGLKSVEVITTLHSGIYQSDREHAAKPIVFEPTQAGIMFALDTAGYKFLSNRGSYGSIGCGTTAVYLIFKNGARFIVNDLDDIDNELWDKLPTGKLNENDVMEITGNVWDGNNHISFFPENSWRYVDNPVREMWDVDEWLDTGSFYLAGNSDEELIQLAGELEQEARNEGILLNGNAIDYLRELQEKQKEEGEE